MSRKLGELLRDRQDVGVKNASLLHKEKLATRENQTLKSKLNELQARVINKAAQMAQLEGTLIIHM